MLAFCHSVQKADYVIYNRTSNSMYLLCKIYFTIHTIITLRVS
jgi:hypothetical protein